MGLSPELISQFVKITNDKKEPKKEAIVNGTVVVVDGYNYVKLDGSERLTPVAQTTTVVDGERVLVTVKDHDATITGNYSSPSARQDEVDKVTDKVEEQLTEIGNVKIDIAAIDHALINKAEIGWVEANYAHIVNGYLDMAQIQDASIGTAMIKDAEITVAKIQNAFVDDLVANQGKFQSAHIGVLTSSNLSADSITAEYIKAVVIDAINLNVNGLISADRINTNGLVVNNIDAGKITTGTLDANRIKSTVISAINLSTETAQISAAKIGNIDASKITTGSLDADRIKANVISAINASIGKISADRIDVDSIVVDNLDASVITTGDLDAERIKAQVISAINSYTGVAKIKQAQIETLKVGSANITDLDVSKLTGDKIDAKFIDTDNLQVDFANVTGTLTADKIKGGTLDASDITVTNLKASSITVGQINGNQISAGAISKDKFDAILSGEWNTMTDEINQALEEAGLIRSELEVVNESAASKVTKYFAKNQNATSAPTTDWSKNPPTWQDGYYIWEKIETEYLDGTKVESAPVNITGAKGTTGSQGPTGPTGNGISNIVKEFYLSTSKTAQSGGAWQTTVPPWEINKYLWTREKITYTNSTTPVYTTPQVSSEWEAINSIEVGGRNLVKNTSKEFANGTMGPWNSQVNTPIHMSETTLKAGDTITYRLYLKFGATTDGGAARLTFRNSSDTGLKTAVGNYISANSEGYSEVTATIPEGTNNIQILAQRQNSAADAVSFSFQYKLVKAEVGNKATDWTPAPEDVDAQIQTVTSIANGKNTIYYATSAPSITGKKVDDIWFDTDDGNRIYRFTGSAWAAAQFGQNAIAANSIVGNHIVAGTISAGKLAANSVVAANIAADAVVARNIKAGEITAGKLATNSVVAGNISAGAITTDKLNSKAVTAEKLDVNEIFANQGFITQLSAVEINTTQITTGQISGDRIDIKGLVSYEALNTELQPLFDVTGNKTYINGGMVAANTIKANSIDLLSGITVQGPDNTITFSIANDGNVTVNGLVQSGNFDEAKKTGYRLSTDGKAILNQAIIRGKIELPNSGMTNDYDMTQVEGRNLITNTDYSNGITTNWSWYSSTAKSDRALISEDQSPYGNAIEYTWTVAGASGPYYTVDQSVMDKLVSGKKYVVSAWIKSSVDGIVNVAFEGRTSVNVTLIANKWTYVTLVATENKATNKAIHFYYNASQAVGTKLAIHSLKLEAGEVASEWSAAPEDNLNPVRIWAGSSYDLRDSAPFRVMQNGDMYAYNAILTGILYGRVDSGYVNINEKELTIVDDTVIPSVEYVKLSPEISSFNTDLILGTLSDKRLNYSNTNRTLDITNTDLNLSTTGVVVQLNNSTDWAKGLAISSNLTGHTGVLNIGHSTGGWINTHIITSSGGKGTTYGDINVRREVFTEDVDMQIEGNIKFRSTMKSTKHNIEMRSVSNEGWGFYAS